MRHTRRTRLLIRVVDGASYLQLLAVIGIATVLITRALLAANGYPQVGKGSLHIAHVLWGGLLMLIALGVALMFVGAAARVCTAVIGGAGLGLFVDEVGKFLTKTNNYFYRPAAAIIYLVFVGLLVLSALVRRERMADPQERVANAAEIAAAGVASGLTSRQRAFATSLLGPAGGARPATADDPELAARAKAVAALLAAAPERHYPALFGRLAHHVSAFFGRLTRRRWFVTLIVVVFVVQAIAVGIVFLTQAVLLAAGNPPHSGEERHAVIAAGYTTNITTVLALVGVAMLRRDRRAGFGWLRAAVLVDLLVTQVFFFTDSQFRAVSVLPFDLLVLAVFTDQVRRPGLAHGSTRDAEAEDRSSAGAEHG